MLSDASSLAAYVADGLGPKVILGVPFYGYDFPASRATPPADTVGSPYTVTYSDVVQSINQDARKPLWDPTSETPYDSFQRAAQWHQTWFDNPVSIALKTALAAQFKVAGVGAWELGMADSSPQMLTLLAGGSPVKKEPLAHPPSRARAAGGSESADEVVVLRARHFETAPLVNVQGRGVDDRHFEVDVADAARLE